MFNEFADDNSISDSVAFLENCELADCDHSFHAQPRMMAFDVDERAAEGMVIGDTITSIPEGMSPTNKRIVKDTLLYATLAANGAKRRAQKEGKPDSDGVWYATYRKVLGDCGWVTPRHGSNTYQVRHSRFTMDQVALDILKSAIMAAALPGPTQLLLWSVAKDTVDALQKNDKPLRLFERYANHTSGAKFAIASSAELSSGEVIMALGSVRFQTRLNVTNFLFWKWNASTVGIRANEDHVNLNLDHYNERAREIVERRLTEEARKALENIEF